MKFTGSSRSPVSSNQDTFGDLLLGPDPERRRRQAGRGHDPGEDSLVHRQPQGRAGGGWLVDREGRQGQCLPDRYDKLRGMRHSQDLLRA
jgi:hypothetical protein